MLDLLSHAFQKQYIRAAKHEEIEIRKKVSSISVMSYEYFLPLYGVYMISFFLLIMCLYMYVFTHEAINLFESVYS